MAPQQLTPHGDPPLYFTFPGLAALGLPHATTSRHCPGIASFAEPVGPSPPRGPFGPEAETVLAGAGLDLTRVAFAKQVHGADVLRAPAGGGFAGSADVLVIAERALPLAVFTADCLAITLWDPEVAALALAHVGWRGTIRGAAQAAVGAILALGARPERIHAVIAPSIGPCCYEVDAPVIDAFAAAYPSRAERWFTPVRPGHAALDLWTANEELLVDTGVDRARIENPRLCTACHPDLLYSYRRDNRGRLVTLAALP